MTNPSIQKALVLAGLAAFLAQPVFGTTGHGRRTTGLPSDAWVGGEAEEFN